jgi:signal transduction histidine kinase/ActR/RegA family two-component response regulator
MKEKDKKQKGRIVRVVLFLLFGAFAISGLSLFIYYNNRSREAVQAERENYTSEIAKQLSRNIDNLQNSYANEIREGANLLATVQPQSQKQLSEIYPDRENARHFLIGTSGKVYDTSGGLHTLSDENFTVSLAQSADDEVVLSHTMVDVTENYLLFGEKVSPITVAGVSYSALAIGVTSDQFRQNMTISLFNGAGAGYLITKDGAIFIGPDTQDLKESLVSGYNLFSALEKGGVPESRIQNIQSEMADGQSKATVTVNGIQWMIEIQSTQFENDYIVVTVPLTLTAAQTYLSMTLTLVFGFVFITALAAIMILILLEGQSRKREEDRKAAAVQAQTDFLAKMSHDIRTPLNAVNGMLELASDPRHSREEVDGFVSKASESANYLLELINGMLDLQKINSGKMTIAHDPFSLRDLLETIASMYKPVIEEKGLHFVLEGEDLFTSDYSGDAIKIKEILMNLLSNAMKFTPEGGSVSLIAQKQPINEKKDEVTLMVRDTGIGMSEEFQAHMFTPFEQEQSSVSSAYVGTGLGLSIVSSLTKILGGSVRVESALGKGSTFFIQLPLERTALAVPKKNTAADLVPFNHQKVLLAEDNEINQQIVILLLKERLSLDVTAVDNGREAVDAFLSSKPGTYSVILLDLRMPVMNGLEAAKAIRASSHPDAKKIPIIALSANTYAEDVRQSLEAGMNAHLAKPIDLNELSAKLHEVIQ